MRYTLDEIQEKVLPIAKAYDIESLGVFGSYARQDAHEDSDIDICIGKGSLKSLLQYFSFVHDLQKTLDCHVDVVTTDIEDKAFLEHILAERVLLYER